MKRSYRQRMISRFIGEEAKANSRRKKKRPWKQVVAIGLARARKEGLLVAKPSAIPVGSSYSGYRMTIGKSKTSHRNPISKYKKVGRAGQGNAFTNIHRR